MVTRTRFDVDDPHTSMTQRRLETRRTPALNLLRPMQPQSLHVDEVGIRGHDRRVGRVPIEGIRHRRDHVFDRPLVPIRVDEAFQNLPKPAFW